MWSSENLNGRICDEVFSFILKNVPYSHVVSEAYIRYMGLKNEKMTNCQSFVDLNPRKSWSWLFNQIRVLRVTIM